MGGQWKQSKAQGADPRIVAAQKDAAAFAVKMYKWAQAQNALATKAAPLGPKAALKRMEENVKAVEKEKKQGEKSKMVKWIAARGQKLKAKLKGHKRA